MQFKFTPEVEAFRAEVKTFLDKEWDPSARPSNMEGGAEAKAFTQGFQKKLANQGWLAMAWPKQYGGGGASFMHQVAYNEEMAYAGAPSGNMGINWVGPALMLYGNDEQKEKFIPRITGVDDWWCTLYSEPGAGSDLAALQTRAVRDGDDFVVNGSKIWTSGGHMADWGWLAVRTNPDAPKHRGISMMLLDMTTPGVSIRPLINMAGNHGFNEVFFEDVRIPASNLIGEENRGWYYLAAALDFERTSISIIGSGRRQVDDIVKLIKSRPELIAQKKAVRTELADRLIEVNVATMMAYQIASMQQRGLIPNKEASVSKLFGSEIGQKISNTRMKLLGTAAQLRNGSKHQIIDAASIYLGNVSSTIAGGSSEVQRNIVATRGLGLPRS